MNNDDRDPPAEREKQVNEKPVIGAPGTPLMEKSEFYEYCLSNGCIGAFYERYPQDRPAERER